MALAQRSFRRLADEGEGLGEQVVQVLTAGDAASELGGLFEQPLVAQRLELRLETVDPPRQWGGVS